MAIKSVYSRFSPLTFHKVSLQYAIKCVRTIYNRACQTGPIKQISIVAFGHSDTRFVKIDMTIKSEYSRFSPLTFHMVSLQYVIKCVRKSTTGPTKQPITPCDPLTSYWSINLGLISPFHAERERYYRHYFL